MTVAPVAVAAVAGILGNWVAADEIRDVPVLEVAILGDVLHLFRVQSSRPNALEHGTKLVELALLVMEWWWPFCFHGLERPCMQDAYSVV